MANRLREIESIGQAIWIDDLSRELLESGRLAALIHEDGVSGVTSNPTIFERAMSESERYDEALRLALAETGDPPELFERLAYEDVRDAAELLRPIFERRGGADGFVSFELPASLARDAPASIAAACRHRDAIARPNVMIKVPGTQEGVDACRELTALGINVNVTLLFGVSRYQEIAAAYLDGVERRLEAGEPLAPVASVASFFVSRVDSRVDAELEQLGRPELRGRAGVANAKLAYRSFEEIFAGERWRRLEEAGARVQRPLWGSTSTKDPNYPDTLYVDELIGPRTVNTMPLATIEAAHERATPRDTVRQGIEEAEELIDEIQGLGVEFERIVSCDLVDEGLKAFGDSYDSLLATLREKAERLAGAAL